MKRGNYKLGFVTDSLFFWLGKFPTSFQIDFTLTHLMILHLTGYVANIAIFFLLGALESLLGDLLPSTPSGGGSFLVFHSKSKSISCCSFCELLTSILIYEQSKTLWPMKRLLSAVLGPFSALFFLANIRLPVVYWLGISKKPWILAYIQLLRICSNLDVRTFT